MGIWYVVISRAAKWEGQGGQFAPESQGRGGLIPSIIGYSCLRIFLKDFHSNMINSAILTDAFNVTVLVYNNQWRERGEQNWILNFYVPLLSRGILTDIMK